MFEGGGVFRTKQLLYEYEINKRKKLSIFAIKELTADINERFLPWLPYLNSFYGHGYILKNFLQSKGIKDCAIQHGLHYCYSLDKSLTEADTVIVFSELYKNYLLELMPWKK